MTLHRIISLALHYVLLYNVHLSRCDMDMCPTGPQGVEPCECLNLYPWNGQIEIKCGPSTHWTHVSDIPDMINKLHYWPTTHVTRFVLYGTNVSGIVDQSTWGPLSFSNINMDNNKIEFIDNQAFAASADTLDSLSLEDNEIIWFPWHNLREFPLLQDLSLKGNNLIYIPSNLINEVNDEMISIDLSRNRISKIGSQAFNKMSKLIYLYLSYNNLTSLDEYVFDIYPYDFWLQLHVSNNYISYISPNAFGRTQLYNLDLSNNLLTTVDEDVFLPMITDSTWPLEHVEDQLIKLSGNPIVCDCQLKWIVDYDFKTFFDDFGCHDDLGHDLDVSFGDLDPSFFNNCTENTEIYKNFKYY